VAKPVKKAPSVKSVVKQAPVEKAQPAKAAAHTTKSKHVVSK
jgi:hypothetical protein